MKCNQCEEQFSRSTHPRHVAVVHAESKEFHCDMCDKAFSANGDLTMHKDAVHEKKKNHKCQFCEDRYPGVGQIFTQVF